MSTKIPWSTAISNGGTGSYTGVPSASFMCKQSMKKTGKKIGSTPSNSSSSSSEGSMENGHHEDKIPAAISSDELEALDSWDPRKLDYESSAFNSYLSGPGALLPNPSSGSGPKPVSVFVDNIPNSCSKEWLRQLFSKVGEVKRVHYEPVKRGRNSTYGFVEFATTREVLDAIQKYNNYEVSRDKKLVVKVKEDRAKREERVGWLNRERDFLNSLNASGELEEVEVDKGVPSNPLEPRYIPHLPTSPEKPTPPAGESGGPSDASLGSSAGAASLKASPPPTAAGEEIGTNKTSPKEPNKGERSKLPCHVCQTPTVKKCCSVPYCSKECQEKDWPIHKKVCSRSKSTAARVQKQPDSSPPAPKKEDRHYPISDGPLKGFYLSTGGADNFEDDLDNLVADASISVTPSKEKPNRFSLDSVLSGSSDKSPCSRAAGDASEVASASSDSPCPYPSLLNSPLSMSLPSQQQLCDDSDDDNDDDDDAIDCHPETPPGSPPVPGQSSMSPADETPPPSQDPQKEANITPTVATDRQSESSSKKKSGVNHLSAQEILDVFDQCPTPLSSHPISEFPPAKFVGIVTSVFSPTQFHVVLATSHVKEALVKLLDYGSSVTPTYCGPADLNEGSLYGYIDDYGDFYRVELVYRSGAVVLYDMGLRLGVQTSRLFQLSEEIKSIPHLCFQMALNKLSYDPDKKEGGREFLFNLTKGRPMSITNHSVRAYKNNVDINFIICSVASLDHSIDVVDQVLKSDFAQTKNEDSSSKSKSQSKDSVFRKKLDSPPSKVDSSPPRKGFPARSPTKAQEDKKNGGSVVAPVSQQPSGGFGSPPMKTSLPLNVRKPMFIDGSPDKIGKLQNSISKNQNGSQSPEIRPQTPPSQKIQSPDSKSGIKYKLVQMSNKVPFHNPPVGVVFKIQPKVVLNPNIIWAQVIHNNVTNFKLMETDLNTVYGSRKNEPYAPAPGEMCAAKYPQDQKYYRVEVLCVNHSGTVDIRLVDHGHRDTVTMRQIHHLEPIFLSLPKQALQFSLVGVVPAGMANTWSDNAIAFLKEKILNRVVSVKIVMQTPSTCMAEVWDPDEPIQLLNASLVELGLAQEPSMFGGHFGVGGGDTGVSLRGVSVTARQDQPPKSQPSSSQSQEQLPPPSLVTSTPDVTARPSQLHRGSTGGAPTPANPMLQFSLPILLKPMDFEKPKCSTTFNPLLSPLSSLPSSATHVETSPTVSASLSKLPRTESESQKSPVFSAKSPVCSVSPSSQGGGWSSKQPSASPAITSSSSSRVSSTKSSESVQAPPKELSSSISSPSSLGTSGWSPKLPSTSTKASGRSPKQSSTSRTVAHSTEPTPAKAGRWCPKQPDSNSSSNNVSSPVKDDSFTATRSRGWSPKPSTVQQQSLKVELDQELSKSSAGRRERSPQAQTGGGYSRSSQKLTINTIQLEPDSKPVEAIVLHVDNPLRFYIQVVKDESCDSYMKMASELNQVDLVPLRNPNSTDFCLCRFPSDGTVGRVKILKVENDSIHVQRLDYGNRKKVTLDALFKMDQRFTCVPAQAIQCTLNQLLNPSGKSNPWMQEAMDFFLDKIGSGKDSPDVVTVKCVQVIRGTMHVVNVTTSAQKGGKDLLGLMVEAKLGGSAAIKFDKSSNQRSRRDETPKGRRLNQSPFSKPSPSTLIGPPIKQSTSSSEGSLSSLATNSSSESTQMDSPFEKPAMKSPFSGSGNKASPAKDSPGKPLFKSEPARASDGKPSSSKRAGILVSAMEKTLLPSKYDVLTLLVTEVCSPDEFYIHTADSAGKSDELFASLCKYFSENKIQPLSRAPALGSLICAKFSQDGAWYRAEVLENFSDSCRVRFVDFGNSEIVQRRDMTECPSEFVSIPILAACCRLGGVAPLTGTSTWSNEATQLLKKVSLIQAEILDSACSPPALKLTTKEGVDIATELIRRGLAAAPRTTPPEAKVEATSVTTYPQVASLPNVLLPSDNDSFTVLVTEVSSPTKLYIQTANSAGKIDDLCTSLFTYFTSNKPQLLSHPPGVGSLVCAKFSQDGTWYRAEVLDISAKGTRVRFIDFGNTETVQLHDMTECPSELVSIAVLASCCQIGGVTPPTGSTTWSDKATQLLKEATSGVPLQAKILDSACSPPALKLTTKEGVDIATELITRGLAAVPRATPAVKASFEMSVTTYSQVASLPSVPLPSDNDSFIVLVTEISSPANLYIQTANSAGKIDELCTSLFTHFTSNKPQPLSKSPGVGSLVCAKFSQDGAWYRADIIEISTDSTRVRFIDFGNTETVHFCDITECPSELISVPILASSCQLGGVTPPAGSTTWSDKATQLLKEATSGVPLQAEILDSACSPPALKLTTKEGVDIATELISRGLAAVPRATPPKANVKATSVTTYPQVASLPSVPLPSDNDSFIVLVTEVSSPAKLYIQTANSAGKIDELCTSLFTCFSSNKPQSLSQPPLVGSLVCAKFSHDGAWYRAKVIEISVDSTRVRFIDFGNTETVHLCDMAECPSEVDSIPILASCCQLGGVTPPTGSTTWSDKATQLLKEATSGVPLQAEILDSACSPPALKLTTKEGVDIATELISRGLAAAPAVKVNVEATSVTTYPQVASLPSVPLPSDNDSFIVLVTEVSSPANLYIQTANSAGKIDELCTSLFTHFTSNKPQPLSKSPGVGSLVCAKFSQDGAWYRADIIEISTDSARVRFVDFGNTETVHLCDITECPSELISVPILASSCQLGGVTPPAGSTTWSDKATQLLKEATSGVPLQAEIVDSACSPPALKLTTKEGVDIATELITRSLAAVPRATPAVKASFEISVTTYPQVASLPSVPLPSDNDSFIVLITEVSSPANLYIQTANSAGKIDELCTSLFTHFTSNKPQPLSKSPGVGSLVCAKFSQDGAWYRADIIEISTDSTRVRFIDFGNTETVHLCDMAECPSELISVPILASSCQLGGVTPPAGSTTWSDKATQLLKEATSGVPLQAEIVDSACSPPALKLTTKEGVDIATELITRGLAAVPRATPAVKASFEMSVATYPQVASLPSVPLPSDNDSFIVLVTEIFSPAKLYIQTANSAGKIDELCTLLFTYFTSNKPQPLSKPPGVGSLVCAKFSQDGAWYRADIIEISTDSTRVRFIDFGNTETVHLCDMAECPSELISVPILASSCQLGGVTPPAGSTTWSDKATQLLKEATSGVPLQAEILNSACSPPALKLTTKEGVDIATELISRGLAAAPAVKVNVEATSVTTYPQVASLPSVPLPSDNDSFTVLVTEVSSPANLYIQTANSVGRIDELCTSLFTYFTSNKPQPLSKPPGVGSLVCAKFSQDGSWYRAEVLDISADGNCVRFIDFGNTETVQFHDMTECPSELVTIPMLASSCQLGGVTPPTGSMAWSDMATQLLKEATFGVPLQAEIIDSACSPPSLKLTTKEGVDLCSILISKGLAAQTSKPSFLSSTEKPTGTPSDKAYPMVASLQMVSLPPENQSFFLMVTDVYSPDELYFQTLEDAGAIDELVELLNKHFSENRPVLFSQTPAVGTLVCAKFSQDGNWYRGEVLETKADCCRVLFIDYGNIESVKLSDVAKCPSEFISSSYPRLASCCQLGGVAPPTGSAAWSKEATQLLISMASNSLSEGIIVDKSASPPSVKLKNDKIADFAAELVTKGLARSFSASPPFSNQHPPNEQAPSPVIECPKVSDMRKIELGSDLDYFPVTVPHIESPEAFFIVPINQKTLMEELRNGLNSHFRANFPSRLSQPPSQGSLVCAKYSKDGEWYRSEVLETHDNRCKLLFIDYGSIEATKLKGIASCPAKYASLPILATKCSLSGVTPSTVSNEAWSSEAIEQFRQLTASRVLNAKVIGEGCGGSGDAVPLELVDTSGSSDVSIASELASRVEALSVRARAAEAMFTEVPIADIPTGVPIKVRFVFVIDPSEFFVHKCEKSSIAAFQELGMTLQSTYNSFESNYRGFVPKLGALCCCQSLLIPDKSWYRCKVISKTKHNKKEARIQSLDFGFIEKIPVDKLLYLDPRFVTLPAQAVPCYLSGLSSTSAFGWNDASKAMFKGLLKEKMNAIVGKEKSPLFANHGKTPISLFIGNANKSVATALIEHGYAVVDPFQALLSEQSAQRHTPQVTSDVEPNNIPPIPVPHGPIPTTKLFPIILTHVESLSEFYLQVVTNEKLEQLCNLLRMVHEYAQTADDFKSQPQLGALCIAMHSDDSWYRAQVVNIVDKQTCSVFFFDFGNVGDVSLSRIKPISDEELLSYPVQSLKCGLYGASAIPSEKLTEVMNLFSTLVPLETVKNCRVVCKYPLLVDLECGSGCPTLSLREELARNDCLPKPNDLGLMTLPSNKLPADSKPVLVTETKDPSDFWLQIIDESIANQFEVLTEKIHDYTTSGGVSAVQNIVPVLGQLCIAKYSQDNVWYRARVIQVDRLGPNEDDDDGKVKVQFIDYGNEEVIDADQLRPFQHQFKCLPAQAVHCSLVGFKLPTPNLAEEFRSLVENKKLFAVKKDGAPGELYTSVELIDSAGDEDVYIHLKLSRH